MSPLHTPGPWQTRVPTLPITTLAATDRMVLARAFDGSEKAIVDRVRGGSPEEANGNALLIAAVPDLFSALLEMVTMYDGTDAILISDGVKAKLGRARAALAKADGAA